MKVIETEIEGVKIIEPDVFGDNRGWLCETYSTTLNSTARDCPSELGVAAKKIGLV